MREKKLDRIVYPALFAALLCVLSPWSIPLQPVPFTFALFMVFLIGAVLPPIQALSAGLCYILIGMVGLPVFSGFRGGLGVLTGMTGGYLITYPIMCLMVALFAKRLRHHFVALALSMLLALLICYTFGTLWFIYSTGNSLYQSLLLCVIPYIWFDLIKIGLALYCSKYLRRLLY